MELITIIAIVVAALIAAIVAPVGFITLVKEGIVADRNDTGIVAAVLAALPLVALALGFTVGFKLVLIGFIVSVLLSGFFCLTFEGYAAEKRHKVINKRLKARYEVQIKRSRNNP